MRSFVWLMALGMLAAPAPGGAQPFVPEDRPGERRLEVPELEEPEEPSFELPEVPPTEPGRLTGAPGVRLRASETRYERRAPATADPHPAATGR